jgi:hypothetical protein
MTMSGVKTIAMVSATVLAIALAACGAKNDDDAAAKQGKSPFATENVSVAPQVEGRPAVPTPLPAPRPTLEP